MAAKKRTGLIHVYTGDGKGKTTAALGLALRASGHGWKVMMICFMKGDPAYGEVINAVMIPRFTLVQSGLPTFVRKGHPSDEDLRLAAEGLELARETLRNGACDMLILDEFNVAVDYGLIPLTEALELLKMKPASMELVLTGRYAHPRILEKADLISEIREIKHPYQKGLQLREGVDY